MDEPAETAKPDAVNKPPAPPPPPSSPAPPPPPATTRYSTVGVVFEAVVMLLDAALCAELPTAFVAYTLKV
jgi:hypothetical protein